MNSLEEQLAVGMREYTADDVPPPDILDRAVRANRRRSTRLGAIGSGVAVVAVLAAVFASTRTPHEPPPPAATAKPSPSASPLTAGDVVQRAIHVLAGADVEHVHLTEEHEDGVTTEEEIWFDPVDNDHRLHIKTPQPGEHRVEMWHIESAGSENTTIYVDHTERTWWMQHGGDPLSTKLPYMPTQLRTKLGDGGYRLSGQETIAGRLAYHLVLSTAQRTDELWVDAGTFQVVRRTIAQLQLAISFTVTLNFDWQPRTPDSLKPFKFTPPAGYRQVPPS